MCTGSLPYIVYEEFGSDGEVVHWMRSCTEVGRWRVGLSAGCRQKASTSRRLYKMPNLQTVTDMTYPFLAVGESLPSAGQARERQP